MKKQGYRCRSCGNTFELEVFEPGEAEKKRQGTKPVRCPDCGSGNLERR